MEDVLVATLICLGLALLILLAAAAFAGWRVWRSDERRLGRRIAKLRFGDKLALGSDLFRDPRVPLWAKVVSLALVVYLASPIDLIPDFIPGLGFLDDLLIVLVGAGLLLRSVPPYVVEEHVRRYEERAGAEPMPIEIT